MNQYQARINVSCSRTQRSDAGVVQTCGLSVSSRALTPLFGNGAGAHGIGKISVIMTKIGKIYIVYCMKFPLLD